MWTSIDEKRPYIDGERIYIGVNDQGFAGCFNELHGVRNPQNNKHYWHCTYMTAEEAIPVLSGLKYWMPLPTVPSNAPQSPAAKQSACIEGLEQSHKGSRDGQAN